MNSQSHVQKFHSPLLDDLIGGRPSLARSPQGRSFRCRADNSWISGGSLQSDQSQAGRSPISSSNPTTVPLKQQEAINAPLELTMDAPSLSNSSSKATKPWQWNHGNHSDTESSMESASSLHVPCVAETKSKNWKPQEPKPWVYVCGHHTPVYDRPDEWLSGKY